jgi:hypothetical protein
MPGTLCEQQPVSLRPVHAFALARRSADRIKIRRQRSASAAAIR